MDGRHSGKPYALQRSLLRSSHAACLPPRRLDEIARSRRRSTISSSSKSCTAFGQGEMHEHHLAICSAYASSGLGGDCLGRKSGRRFLPFAACPHGPRFLIGAKLLVMSRCQCRARQVRPAAGQHAPPEHAWTEAGECSAVSHPHPELLDIRGGILVPTHAFCRRRKRSHIAPPRKAARSVQSYSPIQESSRIGVRYHRQDDLHRITRLRSSEMRSPGSGRQGVGKRRSQHAPNCPKY
jgi:hypothetical protein